MEDLAAAISEVAVQDAFEVYRAARAVNARPHLLLREFQERLAHDVKEVSGSRERREVRFRRAGHRIPGLRRTLAEALRAEGAARAAESDPERLDQLPEPARGEDVFHDAVTAAAREAWRRAPLLWCENRHETVVRVLLQHPHIDVDVQDEKHFTALLYAVSAHQDGIAKALLARGASVKPDARAVSSVLIQASRRNMPDMVRLILEERGGEEAGVDFRDNEEYTALAWASRIQVLDIADMLLRAGAAVDTPDAGGWTPLMHATRFGTGAEMCMLLLDRGADPNLHRPSTTSALITACARSEPGFDAVREALIRAGADVNAQNLNGATPLQVAIETDNNEAVKALLNIGARVKADNAQRKLVDYIYELKRDLEAVLQVFPHALAASSRGS
jgi:ankyrin repeat protein